MNHILEQQKERAKNKATGVTFNPTNDPQIKYFFSPGDLDTLITETHQQAIAECVRIAEGIKQRVNIADDESEDYIIDLQEFIEAITSKIE
jgi:hypothetical protein